MSVLVLAPHMDDEVLGCGGLIQRRADVRVVFATEAPSDVRLDDQGTYRRYSGQDRIAEMQHVAGFLGYAPVRLGFATHALDQLPVGTLVAAFEPLLDGVDLLLVPGPSHDQDHEAVRRAAAVLLRPHCYAGTVLEYLTWGCPGPYDPAVFVPLTAAELDRKVEAIAAYRTQVAPGGRAYAYGPDSLTAYARATGRLVGAEQAEAFLPRRMIL